MDLDFHPTDVLEDADGSVLIVDTGGWYKLCCPTSQLQKPDVLGAIYRVRRSGSTRPADPRGLDLAWDAAAPAELVRRIDDPRPAVRGRAIRTLAARGEPALEPLAARLDDRSEASGSGSGRPGSRGAAGRLDAVWTACRIDHPRPRTGAPGDARRRSGGPPGRGPLRRASGATAQAAADLIALLAAGPAPVARASAEALGRLGEPAAVPALLSAAATAADRVMQHSITYALIELDDPAATRRGLEAPAAATRRAAMIALDQMDGGGLAAKLVAGRMADGDPGLKEAAGWIVGRHPEWAGELADVLGDRLARADLPAADRAELERQLGRFAGEAPIQRLLARRLREPSATSAERRSCLAAIGRSGLKPDAVPRDWVAALAAMLEPGAAGTEIVPPVIASVRAACRSPPGGDEARALAARLRAIAGDASRPAALRLDALAALPGGLDASRAAAVRLRHRPDRAGPVGGRPHDRGGRTGAVAAGDRSA